MSRTALKYHEFTVEGRGSFPVDMLRYDACHPYQQADADAIAQGPSGPHLAMAPRRRVTLQTAYHAAPTVGRWESFGWRVIEPT